MHEGARQLCGPHLLLPSSSYHLIVSLSSSSVCLYDVARRQCPRETGFPGSTVRVVDVPRSLTVVPSLHPLLWFDSCRDRRWLQQACCARASHIGGDGTGPDVPYPIAPIVAGCSAFRLGTVPPQDFLTHGMRHGSFGSSLGVLSGPVSSRPPTGKCDTTVARRKYRLTIPASILLRYTTRRHLLSQSYAPYSRHGVRLRAAVDGWSDQVLGDEAPPNSALVSFRPGVWFFVCVSAPKPKAALHPCQHRLRPERRDMA